MIENGLGVSEVTACEMLNSDEITCHHSGDRRIIMLMIDSEAWISQLELAVLMGN